MICKNGPICGTTTNLSYLSYFSLKSNLGNTKLVLVYSGWTSTEWFYHTFFALDSQVKFQHRHSKQSIRRWRRIFQSFLCHVPKWHTRDSCLSMTIARGSSGWRSTKFFAIMRPFFQLRRFHTCHVNLCHFKRTHLISTTNVIFICSTLQAYIW